MARDPKPFQIFFELGRMHTCDHTKNKRIRELNKRIGSET